MLIKNLSRNLDQNFFSISKKRIENQSHKKRRRNLIIMPQLLWIFVKSSQRYYYPTRMFSLSKIVRVYAKLISLNNGLGSDQNYTLKHKKGELRERKGWCHHWSLVQIPATPPKRLFKQIGVKSGVFWIMGRKIIVL